MMKLPPLQVVIYKLRHGNDGSVFAGSFCSNSDLSTLHDTQAHELHQRGGLGFLAVVGEDNAGIGLFLCQLCNQTGRTGVDAQGIFYGMYIILHRIILQIYQLFL